MNTKHLIALTATTLLLGAYPAAAEEPTQQESEDDDFYESRRDMTDRTQDDYRRGMEDRDDDDDGGALLTGFGGLVTVGGGVGNFVESDLRSATGAAGTWEARGVLGTRSPLAIEAAYVGSAQNIDALGLDDSAALVSNGVESALRLSVPVTQREITQMRELGVPVLVSPYAFGGVGWRRYNLLNRGANTSSVQDEDDIMTLPVGLGLALGVGGVTLDGRATYRHTFFSDLIGNDTSSFSDAALNQWQLGANLGFEF